MKKKMHYTLVTIGTYLIAAFFVSDWNIFNIPDHRNTSDVVVLTICIMGIYYGGIEFVNAHHRLQETKRRNRENRHKRLVEIRGNPPTKSKS